MRFTRSVLARFWLACLLGLMSPLSAHAQFVLDTSSFDPQHGPSMRSLAQACASELDAAAAVGSVGDLNYDLNSVAATMVTGNRAGLESELQSNRNYAATLGPGDERTMMEAAICYRQAALNGAGAPVITPPAPTEGGITMEWFAGLWSGGADCSNVLHYRPDGNYSPDSSYVGPRLAGPWRIEDGNVLVLGRENFPMVDGNTVRRPLERLNENTVRVVGNLQGTFYRCVVAAKSASGYARADAPSAAQTPAPAPRPKP